VLRGGHAVGHRVLFLLAVIGGRGAPALAQGPLAGRVPREVTRLPWLGFSPNGVWRPRARQVRVTRARLLAARQFGTLNAPSLGPTTLSSTVVSGPIVEPVIMFKFQDTPGAEIVGDTLAYDSVLYATTPPYGRPYTVRRYYEQLSSIDGASPFMTITGTSFGFVTLSQNEAAYTGGTSPTCQSANPYGTTNCNGIFSSAAFAALQGGLREALGLLDPTVDWTRFTSHGDTIDLAVFIQPAKDGACGGFPTGTNAVANNHVWSHRSYLASPYTTHSIGPGNTPLQIVDYIIESGVGGSNACDSTQIMPVGTVAHEHGHGFDLPDLYDTNPLEASQGVGEYSLMGSGNYSSPLSPSRMDAWSLSQLGWVTVVPLTTKADYAFGGAPVSDTTYYVRATSPNPRGEYFLLENRQALESDSAMIALHCRIWYSPAAPPAGCGGGLLIYHVDSTQMANSGFTAGNAVNAGPIKGLEVEQADGRGDLDAGRNRGDAGDPYPGATGNAAFSYNTNPAGLKNSDGSFVGYAVDSIRQLAGSSLPVTFRLRFGGLTLVRASDTAAVVHVDTGSYHVFRGLVDSGSTHTLSIDSLQLTNGGRTQERFVSWSNSKARTQTDTAGTTADTVIATVAPANRLVFSVSGQGTIGVSPATDTTGSYLPPGTSVTLTASPSAGSSFAGWAGDTSAGATPLTLAMPRPYTITAIFGRTLSTQAVVAQLLNGTGTLTAADLAYLDFLGNQNGQFDVGDFLAWVNATGAPAGATRPLVTGGSARP